MAQENKVDLKQLFLEFQEGMIHSLNISRKHIPHPGSKGDATEAEWIAWLSKYLPKRYQIDKAFVVDCNGNLSEQIDIVIYDKQYTPFVFHHSDVIYVPAESVYAVFEVKQELDKANLVYASDKIACVRKLKRTSAKIFHAGGEIANPKPPFKIIGGILTSASSWSPALGEAFETIIKDFDEDHFIDMGCSLQDGAFLVKKCDGNITISRSTQDEILLFFFLNLFMELQKKGTVPAMDVLEYAKVLKSI